MICELLASFDADFSGGEGIRTLDTVSRIHTFQACQFNHSCTPPVENQGSKNKDYWPKDFDFLDLLLHNLNIADIVFVFITVVSSFLKSQSVK